MIQRTFDTPDGLALDVMIVAGTITVHTTDAAVTTLRIEGGRRTEDVAVDLFPVGEHGHRLVVEHRGRKPWGISVGASLDVVVTVPSGTAVTCDVRSGHVSAQGPLGSLEVRTASGDVRFDDVEGDVAVKTASGDVRGHRVGGDLSVHSASGDVAVTLVAGGVVIRTASGDLVLGEAEGPVRATTMSGDLQIRALAGPSAELRSVSGDVEVGVPVGRGVSLDLSSVSGDVRSDLEASTAPPDGPDLDLVATTVSGDVRVRRATAVRRLTI
jgi:DUF4097 and DUF4098 domain-containing protein YvlB